MTTYGKTHRSLSAAAAMLRGVHSIYPLTEEEIANLRLLMAVRLACSATLGAYSIAMNPDNEYLKLHAEPAWNSLSFLMNPTNTASIDQFFQQACTSTTNHKDSLYCTDLSFPDPSIPDCLSSIRTSTTEQQFAEGSPPKKKNKPTTTPMSLVFVTGNAKKLEEVQRILQLDPDHFKLSNRKIDLPELQGEPSDIAREKCALAAQQVDGAVITEDTSLCFNALKELPGPYIKWFLDKCGLDGLNQMIEFSPDKTGYAQTVVAYTTGPNQPIHLFDGRTAGTIVSPRGPTHFGWDPIFQPEDSSKTYAEMSKESKDAISHRGRAFSQLRQFLQTK
jgi:inosine triphosphate pyrophosphatase